MRAVSGGQTTTFGVSSLLPWWVPGVTLTSSAEPDPRLVIVWEWSWIMASNSVSNLDSSWEAEDDTGHLFQLSDGGLGFLEIMPHSETPDAWPGVAKRHS